VSGSHVYGSPGRYTVTVAVADGFGPPVGSLFHVDVLDVAPTVADGAALTESPGVPLGLTAGFSDPGFAAAAPAQAFAATIDWGDGTTSPGTVAVVPGGPGVATLGTVSGSHSYASDGGYTVTIAISDGQLTGRGTRSVLDVPPTVV